MDKQVLLDDVIAQLEQNVVTLTSAMEKTVDAATNEETVPEHKYDTLALEASYLAHGQAVRLEQVKSDIALLRKMVLNPFSSLDNVRLTAVVEIEDEDEVVSRFFVLPCAGGLTIEEATIKVVTPHSPLGKALIGKSIDDEVVVCIGEKLTHYAIIHLY
ncbi:GreA/GreB family elongation factor [Vibrio mediterranei]